MTKTALIVDDSESIRLLLSTILKDADYDVLEGINGSDALDKLSASDVDIIVTDLKMPVMDGVELIRNVRRNARYQFIPIVMITSDFRSARIQEGWAAGANELIIKPFSVRQLLETVEGMLDHHLSRAL